MQKCLLTYSLVLVMSFATLAMAQDETTTADVSGSKDDAAAKKKLEDAAEMTQIIMSKMLAKAELDNDQTQKVDEILKENVKKMVFKRDELTRFLTKEQQETYNAAMKMAKKAGYDPEKADKYSLKKLNLPEDKAAAYIKLKKEVDEINRRIFVSIGALMTEEQLKKVPMFKDMMPKTASTEKAGEETANKEKEPAKKAG